jgi:hypothetical protein
VKSRIVLRVLAVVGIFVLSATAAQAGRGSGVPAPLNTFFECQVINGANVNHTVSTCVPGSACTQGNGLIHDGVNVGNGVLLCRQVDVKDSAGFLTPDPSTEIKCYAASRPGKKGSAVQQTLSDEFIRESDSVSQQPGYLCSPVNIE